MIKLNYEPNASVKEDSNIRSVTMEFNEDGHISDYVEAFGNFLKAVGFFDKTIEEALPSYEV